MTYDYRFVAILGGIVAELESSSKEDEKVERLLKLYRIVYQRWFISQSELLQSRN